MFVETKRLFGDVIGKMIKSYATIIFITFCEVAVGLNLLSLFNIYKGGYIIVISIITALLDILPVFGTGTVLIPWGIAELIIFKSFVDKCYYNDIKEDFFFFY